MLTIVPDADVRRVIVVSYITLTLHYSSCAAVANTIRCCYETERMRVRSVSPNRK